MCAGIEYMRDGEPVAVYFDSNSPDLPVRQRGGTIVFYRWGALSLANIKATLAHDGFKRQRAPMNIRDASRPRLVW